MLILFLRATWTGIFQSKELNLVCSFLFRPHIIRTWPTASPRLSSYKASPRALAVASIGPIPSPPPINKTAGRFSSIPSSLLKSTCGLSNRYHWTWICLKQPRQKIFLKTNLWTNWFHKGRSNRKAIDFDLRCLKSGLLCPFHHFCWWAITSCHKLMKPKHQRQGSSKLYFLQKWNRISKAWTIWLIKLTMWDGKYSSL